MRNAINLSVKIVLTGKLLKLHNDAPILCFILNFERVKDERVSMKSYWYALSLLLAIYLLEKGEMENRRSPASIKTHVEIEKALNKEESTSFDLTPIIKKGIEENRQIIKELDKGKSLLEIDFITKEDDEKLPLYRVEFISIKDTEATYHEIFVRTNGTLLIITPDNSLNPKESKLIIKKGSEFISIKDDGFVQALLTEK